MDCFVWLLAVGVGVMVIVSLIRWVEQINEAVRYGWWSKTILLVVFPPAAWFFPAAVTAGRPVPVALHTPVRGFGKMPAERPVETDGPPPGTPAEYLGMPVVPPKKKKAAVGVDPEKLAKLKQKMKEQGMMEE